MWKSFKWEVISSLNKNIILTILLFNFYQLLWRIFLFINNSIIEKKGKILNGWDAILDYNDVEHHHATCEYAIVHCKNEGCDVKLNRPEMEEHEEYWEYERSIWDICKNVIP